ncbi:MAG: ATP-grasp domain-containing protein, partial [Gammaproteobacteria bacterium]|nr:ATP-grasp domain-containing protein [Gammaproteobacteria bacterium]
VLRVMSGVLSQQRPVVVAHRPKHTDVDLIKPVRRVLIHARGCTAAKLIRIAQKNNIEVVLVQSDPDMESTAVDLLWERDSVVCIGGNTPDESYLNAMSVLSVAEHEGVDALHPGIGFLSENAQFAELCRSHGINFIGPPVSSMDTMGNKSNAINTALRLGVPVVPGSHGILTNEERAAEVAEDIGYPVLIKAVHGGGGKGIQVVENASEFHEQFHRVRAEARSAFGNGDVYLEKYITSLRHIEVQLLRDTHGNTLVLGLRDCSVQRDKQKVFEESGSTMLPEHLHKAVLEYPAAIADEVGYVGAGTVEFIYDLDSNDIYFMEMNTRLQVEHPVTEWVSGIDIVTQQFRIASGESIADLTPTSDGYSIEARVTAEKVQMSANGELVFRPHPGEIIEFEFPQDDGVEVIAAASAGKMVSPYYDSMLAQVIVHAKGRRRAINKLLAYLERVKVTGICTNIPLLKRVLQDDVYIEGTYDTNYLTEFLQRTDAKSLIEEIEHAAGEQLVGIDLAAIKIEDSDELKVLSPTTAIFYITPTPSEPQFVSVGDKISVQDTLCQLEAMKLFTPLSLADFNIEAELYDAEMEFEVTRINMANGQQVNAGDLLFVVKPSSS